MFASDSSPLDMGGLSHADLAWTLTGFCPHHARNRRFCSSSASPSAAYVFKDAEIYLRDGLSAFCRWEHSFKMCIDLSTGMAANLNA